MIYLFYGPPKSASSAAFTLGRALIREKIRLFGGQIVKSDDHGTLYGDSHFLSDSFGPILIELLIIVHLKTLTTLCL